ncbi:MAG: hypothetical protein ACFFD4_14830 [Candidatus Odinarchaeota archaeon]
MEEIFLLKQAKVIACLTFCVTILSLTAILALGKPEVVYQGPDVFIITDDEEYSITDHIWSPDGTKIAYVKCLEGQLWKGELWVADKSPTSAELSNEQLIYTGVDGYGLADWLGDWLLVMVRTEEGTPGEYYGRNELWKIRDDGTDLKQVTFSYSNGIRTEWWNTAYTNRGTVNWGKIIPGTDLVYFSAHNGNGWYKAYTCKADGTDQYQLISENYYSFTIALSPTGNKLVWGHATYWNNPTTLMASNADGSHRFTIKAFDYRTFPLVLADGNTIIYSFAPADGNIYAIDIEPPGSNQRTVIDDEYTNSWANYNPVDEQSLLMISDRAPDGNQHVFRINVNGTDIVQLTEGPYDDESPAYSPDGKYILYRRLPDDYDKENNSPPYPYELVVRNSSASVSNRIPVPIRPLESSNATTFTSFSGVPTVLLALVVVSSVLYRRKRIK